MSVVEDFLRIVGMLIDTAVYSVVEALFMVIMDLANVEIFSESIIDEFSSRIYVILGLVMVFKLMISFIQMLINPDKMSDKEQGTGNLLKRVVISLALIFLVPSIFDLARQVQGEIVPLIPKVVIGTKVNIADEDASEKIGNVGRLMAFYSFTSFFTYQNASCNDGSIMGTGGNDDEAEIWSVGSAFTHIDARCDGDYRYSYRWPFTTIVGAYLVYVLVSIAVAIAVRTIKLSVCELVAPIPIASYIDPKTSKQTFDKWVSTTLKTYADLFIRLIIVYFVIFVFQVLFSSDTKIIDQILVNVGGSVVRKSFVVLFIIVGLLQFAKQAPKFLTDMLGLSGAGDLIGMFKGEGWKAIGETGQVAGNLVKAPISNWKELSNTVYADGSRPTFGQKLSSSIAGLGSVTGRTAAAIATGKSGTDLTKTPFDNTTKRRDARIATRNRRASGYSWREEQAEKWRRSMNISSQDDWSVEEFRQIDEMANLMSEAGALGLKKGNEQPNKVKVNFAGEDITYSELQYLAEKAQLGENWRGHILDHDLLSRAKGAIPETEKKNKTEFFQGLLSKPGDPNFVPDAAAVQIHNKIRDRIKNNSAFKSEGNKNAFVDTFSEQLFGRNNSITIDTSDGQKVFNKNDFNYDKLVQIIDNREMFAYQRVQLATKNASEMLRNIKQNEQYEADRRKKARDGASKS